MPHQTQCIECSVAMLSTPIDTHRRTMLYTNTALAFAPDKCIQCYGNTRCEQKQLQLTICFSFGWRECMFYPCLVQTIMFRHMSTHVDTNRQNSPKSIKRQINTETMINDKFGKNHQIYFSRKSSARLETNSFTHNLLTGLYATHCNQNGTKDWLEPAKLALHVAGIFYLLILNHFAY